MKAPLTILLSVTFTLLTAAVGQAQISIPTNNFQPPVGTVIPTMQGENLTPATWTALTGTTGGSQSFDVSGLSGLQQYDLEIASPASAPYIDSFPTANLVFLTTFEALSSDTIWTYNRSVASAFESLGEVARSGGFEMIDTWESTTPEFVFPMAYDDQWSSYRSKSSVPFPGSTEEVTDTSFHHVDGWGTITNGTVSIPCLRVSSTQHRWTTTYFNGTPISSMMETSEEAIFVGEDFTLLAIVGYYPSQFDTSYSVTLVGDLAGTPTDVVEYDNGTLPGDFSLSQNYPNPFNPSTEINFSLPSASHVKLTVYNLLGQETSVLVDQQLPAGSFTADWDGTDHSGNQVASGIYFYRLETGTYSDTKKMMLLK